MYKVAVWNLIWAFITIIRKGHEMTWKGDIGFALMTNLFSPILMVCIFFLNVSVVIQLVFFSIKETPKVQNGGCTVPGCHYPKIFSKNIDQLRNKSFIDCQVQELGMPSYHVECILNCRPGWSPINGINTTMCSQENQPFQLEKLTNFTVDYLECGRVFWGANDLREIIVKYIQTIKNNFDESLFAFRIVIPDSPFTFMRTLSIL